MNIQIKTIFILLGTTSTLLIVLFFWAFIDLANESRELESIEHNRFLMFEKSGELRQSSDELTKFARIYVITGDKKYKDFYFNVLDIRNGKVKRPKDYSLLYWNLPESERINHPLGDPSSLKSEMSKLPFLPFEFDKLDDAERNSNQLVQLEVEAFNTLIGLYKDSSGRYTIRGNSNKALAIELLHSKQYQVAKNKILAPIDEFQHSLSNRTNKANAEKIQLITNIFIRIYIILGFALTVMILTFISLTKRVFSPIEYLTKVITSFKEGNKLTKKKIFYHDEIGTMIESFFDMKQEIDEDLKRLEFALSAGHQGWYELNPQTGKFIVSEEYAKLIGFTLEEIGSDTKDWQSHIHTSDKAGVELVLKKFYTAKEPVEFTYRRLHRNGTWVWLHTVGQAVQWDVNDKPIKIVGVHTDITQSKLHEFRENMRNQVLELLIKDEPLNSILTSVLNAVENGNPDMICSILLSDKEKTHLFTGVAPLLPDFYNNAIDGITIGDGIGSCGTSAFRKTRVIVEDIQSHPYWKEFKELAKQANLAACWSQPIIGTNNSLLGTFAIYHRHISSPSEEELKLIEFIAHLAAIAIEKSQINKERSLSDRLFSDTHEGIIITDEHGIMVNVNPACCNISGYSREELIGKSPSILSSGKQSPDFYRDMWKSLKENAYWQGEIWNRNKNGEIYAELISISELKNDTDNTINYVGLFTDITKSKKQQEKLNLLAHYDELTQLPNRTLFNDKFHLAIKHSIKRQNQLAICFLDLDNFKPINDTFGHAVGDLLLVEVAKRITLNIREEDTVSRQGGDEFALLLGDIYNYSQCEIILQQIHNALAEPFVINGQRHDISASTGITIYPNDKSEPDTLIRHADQAMYHAKLAGKNRYHLFSTEQDQLAMTQHTRLGEIREALYADQFELYYQPKINMKTGAVFGAEALIRWIHPDKGLIPPLDFLPIIEETPLEIEIGDWVIKQALSQLSNWKLLDIELEVSVNISSNHLLSKNFISKLEKSLSNYENVDSSDLQLEILESSALSDLKMIGQIIKKCRKQVGVNVALDDFGTGYSSLTHLRNLSANTIKIDQTFVRDMLEDPSDYAIIDGIIGLARSFDRKIIAEGVETTEQGLMLILMGCEEAQGYGIAKPMPAVKISEWLTEYQSNSQWIAYGNRNLTLQESKIEIFKLAFAQWKQQFLSNIQSSPDGAKSWPITDKTKCPCGTWIKRAKQEQLFDNSWLETINQAHDALHRIADDLIFKYNDGDIYYAKKNLPLLQSSFEETDRLVTSFKSR
ncbi:MAG: hypothetical protein COA86_17440 [Kangiella sp.]|nr:MAG: hypothetical protein COA86_17440 [Kangiella sp.]